MIGKGMQYMFQAEYCGEARGASNARWQIAQQLERILTEHLLEGDKETTLGKILMLITELEK